MQGKAIVYRGKDIVSGYPDAGMNAPFQRSRKTRIFGLTEPRFFKAVSEKALSVCLGVFLPFPTLIPGLHKY